MVWEKICYIHINTILVKLCKRLICNIMFKETLHDRIYRTSMENGQLLSESAMGIYKKQVEKKKNMLSTKKVRFKKNCKDQEKWRMKMETAN